MQDRFGLKDFVLWVAVLVLAVLTVLRMLQGDRVWKELQAVRSLVGEQRQIVTQMQVKLDSGDFVASGGGTAGRVTRDESWARPGVPVTWPKPFLMAHDPTQLPGYSEGGTFTEIFEAQFPKIVPFTYTDVYGRRIIEDLACESLAAYDTVTLEYRALLGEAWQIDPELMWIRVKINDRAVFSDGVPVTAEDVRFTFENIIMNPDIEAERFRSTMRVIESVVPLSEKVVEFRFREARFNNDTEALRFVILPKHFYEQFSPAEYNRATGLLMGSGAYKLERLDPNNQWKPGEPVVMVRNDQYWGRRPAIDRHRFTVVQDNIARLTAYENGDGDMMRATPEQFAIKSEDAGFVARHRTMAWVNMRSGYAYISWNCGLRNGRPTPFVDPRVRLAMTMLLDRERINRDFYAGLATVATGPFNPETAQSNPEIEPWPYNPERAKELLTEAGWIDRNNDGILENERGDRFSFDFTVSSGSSLALQVGNYLKDQCARIGIIVNIDVQDWSIGDSKRKARDFDAMTLAWSWSRPEVDPMQIWHSRSIDNQGDNYVQWRNAEADELIEAGQRAIDREERQRIWHRLHTIIHEEQPYTFLLNIPWIRFVNNRVENVHPAATGVDKREFFFPAQ